MRTLRRWRQRGVAALELALVTPVFLLFFFGLVEVARAMYICNTLQEVTRRGAALAVNADFSNDAAMLDVRVRAVFRTTPGGLVFADPISDANVKIDYLQIPTGAASPAPVAPRPDSPEKNWQACTNNPNAANCIQLVRVRICLPDGGANCTPVPYRALTSFIPFTFSLPVSTTIAKAESLGLPPGLP